MAAPGQRGVYSGRNRAISDTDIADVKLRVVAGGQKAQIARNLGISRESLPQCLRISE
jgi:DNA invertase Pin-like site-specific DNA recombinase